MGSKMYHSEPSLIRIGWEIRDGSNPRLGEFDIQRKFTLLVLFCLSCFIFVTESTMKAMLHVAPKHPYKNKPPVHSVACRSSAM